MRAAVRRALMLGGYDVIEAGDGSQGLSAVESSRPDGVVLDLGLPGLDGMEVCRRLRARDDGLPILMLTARDAIEDRVDGLEAGADDYLVKPYDVRELLARMKALMRRNLSGEQRTLRFAELSLDAGQHSVRIGDRTVRLTRTEYQLLELLMSNPRQVLTGEVIYDRIWGYDFGPTGNALRVYIGYLRRKLEADGSRRLIQTVHGVGYVLREP